MPVPTVPSGEVAGDRGPLRLIALFKFAKTVALVAVAAAAFGLLGQVARDRAVNWLTTVLLRLASATEFRGLRGALGGLAERAVGAAIQWLSGATPGRLEVTGVVALLYALIVGTEGVGLWLGKSWAEWFSVLVTASLIPLEVLEIVRQVTLLRVAVFVVNVAVVVYLARRVVRERRAHQAALAAATAGG